MQKAARHHKRLRSLLSHGVAVALGPHQRRATQTLRGCQGPAQAARAMQAHACQQDWMRAWQARPACAGTPGNPSAHLFASRYLFEQSLTQITMPNTVPRFTRLGSSKQCTIRIYLFSFLALMAEMQPVRTFAGRGCTASQALFLHRRPPQQGCCLQRIPLARRGQTL